MIIVQIITFILALVALILAAKKSKGGGVSTISIQECVNDTFAPIPNIKNMLPSGSNICYSPTYGIVANSFTTNTLTTTGDIRTSGNIVTAGDITQASSGLATFGKQVIIKEDGGLVLEKGNIAVDAADAYITVGDVSQSERVGGNGIYTKGTLKVVDGTLYVGSPSNSWSPSGDIGNKYGSAIGMDIVAGGQQGVRGGGIYLKGKNWTPSAPDYTDTWTDSGLSTSGNIVIASPTAYLGLGAPTAGGGALRPHKFYWDNSGIQNGSGGGNVVGSGNFWTADGSLTLEKEITVGPMVGAEGGKKVYNRWNSAGELTTNMSLYVPNITTSTMTSHGACLCGGKFV